MGNAKDHIIDVVVPVSLGLIPQLQAGSGPRSLSAAYKSQGKS